MNYSLRPDRDLTILIPARAGSRRVPGKNTKLLGGKPLIQWTIEAARAANVCEIVVSTDDPAAGVWARERLCRIHYRKAEHATDGAPDILWMLDLIDGVSTPYIAICRPTSPFRTASTIRRGYAAFIASGADSLRAVEPVKEHPGKMWMDRHGLILPVMPNHYVLNNELPVPWHSMPTQRLPIIYKQNASLEIAKVDVIKETRTISGYRVKPFFTETLEGFDINTPEDWAEAEIIAASLLSPAPSPFPEAHRPGS